VFPYILIGKKLIKGCIIIGRLYDECGNYRPWWTNTTAKEYYERTKCFVEQYSKYRISELHANVNIYGHGTWEMVYRLLLVSTVK
jgi:predicted metalloendopeptidase